MDKPAVVWGRMFYERYRSSNCLFLTNPKLDRPGEVTFSDAYDEGQEMSLEETVGFALGES